MSTRTHWVSVVLVLLGLMWVTSSAVAGDRISIWERGGCVIRNDGTLGCWGESDGRAEGPPRGTFRHVSTGSYNCAIRTDGIIKCWSAYVTGPDHVLRPPAGRYKQISMGPYHACALTDEVFPRPKCWGNELEGGITPPWGTAKSYLKIEVEDYQTCAVGMSATIPDSDPFPQGDIDCWGGYPGTDRVVVELAFAHSDMIDLGAQTYGGCAIESGSSNGVGNVVCWGIYNTYGERNWPAVWATKIASSAQTNCVIRTDRSLYCWGANHTGQATPPVGNDFIDLDMSAQQGCALRANGGVTCWGGQAVGGWYEGFPRVEILDTTLAPVLVGESVSRGLRVAQTNDTSGASEYFIYRPAFRLVGGAIPAGLKLAADGVISGKALTAGTFNFSVVATDGNGFSTPAKALTLIVQPYSAIQPTISIKDVVAREGVPFALQVELSAPSATAVTFALADTPGTALAHAWSERADYYRQSDYQYSIPAGSTTMSFSWYSVADGMREPAEYFNVLLRNVSSAVVNRGVARVTILDDDGLAIHDFDGDRRSDVLWRNLTGAANAIWLGAHQGTPLSVRSVTDANWAVAGMGDFNGDGKSDILWNHRVSGASTIWYSGNSAAAINLTTVTNLDWRIVGVGDFDGNGRDDVLWRNKVSGRNAYWRGGQYADQGVVRDVTDTRWRVGAIGDLNGDARADIVWSHITSGANSVWYSAEHTGASNLATVSSLNWRIGGIGDFDGDGYDDLLWRNLVTGANAYWRRGQLALQVPLTGLGDVGWQVGGVGDFDGDMRDDILWRHSTTGQNSVWYGASAGESFNLATALQNAWRLAPAPYP